MFRLCKHSCFARARRGGPVCEPSSSLGGASSLAGRRRRIASVRFSGLRATPPASAVRRATAEPRSQRSGRSSQESRCTDQDSGRRCLGVPIPWTAASARPRRHGPTRQSRSPPHRGARRLRRVRDGTSVVMQILVCRLREQEPREMWPPRSSLEGAGWQVHVPDEIIHGAINANVM